MRHNIIKINWKLIFTKGKINNMQKQRHAVMTKKRMRKRKKCHRHLIWTLNNRTKRKNRKIIAKRIPVKRQRSMGSKNLRTMMMRKGRRNKKRKKSQVRSLARSKRRRRKSSKKMFQSPKWPLLWSFPMHLPLRRSFLVYLLNYLIAKGEKARNLQWLEEAAETTVERITSSRRRWVVHLLSKVLSKPSSSLTFFHR